MRYGNVGWKILEIFQPWASSALRNIYPQLFAASDELEMGVGMRDKLAGGFEAC
jgi:hypothetical protein